MYTEIIQKIQLNQLQEAEQLFCQNANIRSEEYYIIGATIYMNIGDEKKAYGLITEGIRYAPYNAELYLLLGNYYEKRNWNQAWLCYEQAEFYCDSKEDLEVIQAFKDRVSLQEEFCVQKTSVVILSYNTQKMLQSCINSIKETVSSTACEIIIVDNNSEDSSKEWLEENRHLGYKLICNMENKGFPYGCNQGIKISEADNDIFLLNSDTIVTQNALFWLRMGLYEDKKTGAVGSVTNNAPNLQKIDGTKRVEEWLDYAVTNNVPMERPYEEKVFLVGFALLIKRRAMDQVGLLDTIFSPGTYEDNDYCMRLHRAGWSVRLCHNSFIFHYGSGDGKNKEKWADLNDRNHGKLNEKWGFDGEKAFLSREELIARITNSREERICVLEVGCGAGSTLYRIAYRWPNAVLHGIEADFRQVQLIDSSIDVLCGDVQTMELPYKKSMFDYIILSDILEYTTNPEEVINRLKPFLKPEGRFIGSVQNVMHYSKMIPLMDGETIQKWNKRYEKKQYSFFTLGSLIELFAQCGFGLESITGTQPVHEQPELQKRMEELIYKMPDIADRSQFVSYQYIFSARIK